MRSSRLAPGHAVAVTAWNVGDTPALYGAAQHLYLWFGEGVD
jgi:hypothetical protein